MNECSKWVKYWFWQEKIIFISTCRSISPSATCHCVILILTPKIRNFVTQSIWSNLVVRWLSICTCSSCKSMWNVTSTTWFPRLFPYRSGGVGIQHTSLILSIREFTQFATNWEFKRVTTSECFLEKALKDGWDPSWLLLIIGTPRPKGWTRDWCLVEREHCCQPPPAYSTQRL